MAAPPRRIGTARLPRVEVLKEPTGHVTIGVEFVDGAEQERLVEHRGEERVGDVMARHVQQGNAGHALTALEVLYEIRSSVSSARWMRASRSKRRLKST